MKRGEGRGGGGGKTKVVALNDRLLIYWLKVMVLTELQRKENSRLESVSSNLGCIIVVRGGFNEFIRI